MKLTKKEIQAKLDFLYKLRRKALDFPMKWDRMPSDRVFEYSLRMVDSYDDDIEKLKKELEL